MNTVNFSQDFARWWVGSKSNLDVLLATDITQDAAKKRVPFYDKISELCANLGHPTFCPYKEFGVGEDASDEECRRLYTTIQDVVIPGVKLVIADMSIESTEVGMMLARTLKEGKPIIYFKTRKSPLPRFSSAGVVEHQIGSPEVQGRLAESYMQIFANSFPFALVKYDTQREALKLLEVEIKDYFLRRYAATGI